MSDQGGMSAGWHPDPEGRHEYRYRDEDGWTDQVSDGGVTSTDPPGSAATAPMAAAPGAPPADKPKRKVPVGILALIGVVIAAAVAGAVILLAGGDDGGGDDAGGGAGEDGGEEAADGDLSGTISEDEPFTVRAFDLEAGEAVRIVVEPDGDLDARLTLGLEPELAATELFVGTDDVEVDDLLADYYGLNYDDLFSDSLDSDLSADLSEGLSDDFSDFVEQLDEEVPGLSDAGVPLFTIDENEGDDPEGHIFVAPLAGQYSFIISGAGSEGDFDGAIGTAGPAEDFDEPDDDDDIDDPQYYSWLEDLRVDLCDEDFWGGDPADVNEEAGRVCDDDEFEALLSDDGSDDFTSDFSDDFSSDVSDDFSSDFSDDFSDDFSSDFSDDTGDDLEVYDPVPPADAIDNWGARPHLEPLAEFCFDGDLIACDDLYELSPSGLVGSYRDYGRTCGLRVTISLAGRCESRLG